MVKPGCTGLAAARLTQVIRARVARKAGRARRRRVRGFQIFEPRLVRWQVRSSAADHRFTFHASRFTFVDEE